MPSSTSLTPYRLPSSYLYLVKVFFVNAVHVPDHAQPVIQQPWGVTKRWGGYTAALQWERKRELTEVLSFRWRPDGSAVIVTFDEEHGVTLLHKTTVCAYSIPVTKMSVTWGRVQRYIWRCRVLSSLVSQLCIQPTAYSQVRHRILQHRQCIEIVARH